MQIDAVGPLDDVQDGIQGQALGLGALVGVVHRPPVGGVRQLILGEGQVIPAGGVGLHLITMAGGNEAVRQEIAAVAQVGVNGHVHGEGAMLEVQAVGLALEERAGPAAIANAGNVALREEAIHMGEGLHEGRFGAVAVHLREEQHPHSRVHGAGPPAAAVLPDPLRHRAQIRAAQEVADHQVQDVIGIRIDLLAQILPGGVVGEDGIVRVEVAVHHLEVLRSGLEVGLIAGSQVQADHLIVVDLVVVAGAALGEFAILVDVQSLPQELAGAIAQGLVAGDLLAAQQAGGDGPAMIGRMETAGRDAAGGRVDQLIHRLAHKVRLGGLALLQQPPAVEHGIDHEGGIRRGGIIAGRQVEAAVGALVILHINQVSADGLGQAGRQIPTAALGAEGSDHIAQEEATLTGLHMEILGPETAVTRIARIGDLPLDEARDDVIQPGQKLSAVGYHPAPSFIKTHIDPPQKKEGRIISDKLVLFIIAKRSTYCKW